MRVIVAGLLGASVLVGLATAPAEAASRAKKKYVPSADKQYRDSARDGYYEHLADKLPFGSRLWWDQMMRERRGGRPG